MRPVELASCCAALLAWLMFKPAPKSLRLGRLLETQAARDQGGPERLLRPVLAWWEAFLERRRTQQRWRGAVIELCDGMASELAAGRTPDDAFALTAALLDPSIAAQLLDTSSGRAGEPPLNRRRREGGTITSTNAFQHSTAPLSAGSGPGPFGTVATEAPGIRRSPRERMEELARQPGAEGLRLLAACWRIGAERGGTLATVLDDLAGALRDEEAQRQEIATQLAGPRATARLLSGLPLLGLGMAAALGSNSLAFLFGTLPGLGCLVTGLGLNLTGLWWTHRLARSAENPS